MWFWIKESTKRQMNYRSSWNLNKCPEMDRPHLDVDGQPVNHTKQPSTSPVYIKCTFIKWCPRIMFAINNSCCYVKETLYIKYVFVNIS